MALFDLYSPKPFIRFNPSFDSILMMGSFGPNIVWWRWWWRLQSHLGLFTPLGIIRIRCLSYLLAILVRDASHSVGWEANTKKGMRCWRWIAGGEWGLLSKLEGRTKNISGCDSDAEGRTRKCGLGRNDQSLRDSNWQRKTKHER